MNQENPNPSDGTRPRREREDQPLPKVGSVYSHADGYKVHVQMVGEALSVGTVVGLAGYRGANNTRPIARFTDEIQLEDGTWVPRFTHVADDVSVETFAKEHYEVDPEVGNSLFAAIFGSIPEDGGETSGDNGIPKA